MERKFYTDDFEQLLKDKSDEFRMYPSKRVWHSIYNDLHPGRKWPSIAVSMLLVIVLLMMGYWNNNSSKASVVTAAATTTKNTANTVTAKATAGTHNTILQQPAASLIAYQNQTTIQQPFGIYNNNTDNNNTEAKSNTSPVADNKNTQAQQPSINWNVALGQFSNIASTSVVTNSSLLNNAALFSINGLDNKNNSHFTENTDELGNIVALPQTENNKTLLNTAANTRIKTAVTIDKRGGNKNADLPVNTDKDNAGDINSVAGDNNVDKVDAATSATAKPALAVNKKTTAEQGQSVYRQLCFLQ
ncbi:MAG: hypothetical protein WDM90_12780 [Ferruginibacter sp.]